MKQPFLQDAYWDGAYISTGPSSKLKLKRLSLLSSPRKHPQLLSQPPPRSEFRQWLRDVWYKSWTAAYGKFKIMAGSAIVFIHLAGNVVNDPGVKAAIEKLELPVYVGLG